MDEIEELIKNTKTDPSNAQGDDGSKQDTTVSTTPNIVEVNGAKYDLNKAEDITKMQTDYMNLTKHAGKLANDIDKARKVTPPASEETKELTPEMKKAVTESLKSEFGVVTRDELDKRDYVKAATAEINRLAEKYGINKEAFAKSLSEYPVRIDPSRFEKLWQADHTDEYLKWRQEAMKADQTTTPYTMRTNKEGIELPSQTKPRFGETVVSKALELIGAKE